MKFVVIDKSTRKIANTAEIALNEEWTRILDSARIEGFALKQDGDLILTDQHGRMVYCPNNRFELVFDTDSYLKEMSNIYDRSNPS